MRKAGVAVLLGILLLCGCGAEGPGSAVTVPALISHETALFAKPVVTPSVLTDQTGYDTGAEKMVLFRGETLPAEYEIRRVSDAETVFTGSVTPWPEETVADNDVRYYGVFTDFQTEGTYYIFAEGIGESYSFRIGQGVDEAMLSTALNSFTERRCGTECHTAQVKLADDPTLLVDVSGGWHTENDEGRDTVRCAKAMDAMLLAYEINTARFTEENDLLEEVRTGAEWLLKMQTTDGKFYAGVRVNGEEETVEGATDEATIAAAAALAKFSFHYKNRDEAVAEKTQQAAVTAYSAVNAGRSGGTDAAAFFAAAELYRITGEKKYENTLSAMFQRSDFERVFLREDDVFYGGVTYIATKQPVNVAVCEQIMELLRVSSEQIANAANRSPYRVTQAQLSAEDVTAIDTILNDMRTLAVTDHIIYNHEYTTVIENHVHFLRGRNPLALNFVSSDTEHTYRDMGWTGILDDPVRAAFTLLMVSML